MAHEQSRYLALASALLLLAAAAPASVERKAGGGRGDEASGVNAYVEAYGIRVVGTDLYIADGKGNEVRRLDAAGKIHCVAGMGKQGSDGDNGPATAAKLSYPTDVVVDTDGTVYILDSFNSSIRSVAPDGTMHTIATGLQFADTGLDLGPDHALYVAEPAANRVQRIGPLPCSGTCPSAPFAGGTMGFSGDDHQAKDATMRNPSDVRWMGGFLYVADTGNNRVRRIGPDGVITTIAGNGNSTAGPLGDGGPAKAARINAPRQVDVGPDGTVYVSEGDGNRIRAFVPGGNISTVLGTGAPNMAGVFSSDPLVLTITQPIGVAAAGGVLWVGSEADRVVYAMTLDTPTPTVTKVATATSSPTLTIAMATITASPTSTRTVTATETGTPTAVATFTQTASATVTALPPLTATATASLTRTATATVTASATATRSATLSASASPTTSNSPTPTDTAVTLTATPSLTPNAPQMVLICDVSMNGTISSLDAAWVLQATAGVRVLSPVERLAADATGDGTMSALDGTRILQWAAGMRPPDMPASRCGTLAPAS